MRDKKKNGIDKLSRPRLLPGEKVHGSTTSAGIVLLTLVALLWVSPVFGEPYWETRPPLRGADINIEELKPADVYARVGVVQKELELIRFEMGRPKIERSHLHVTQAVPREVYFQALTLYEKASRLAFEQSGSLEIIYPYSLPSDIRPGDVWRVVDAALSQVLLVRDKLGIREKISERLDERPIMPTDVFQFIVVANRQLNLLLNRQYAPRDVYRKVTLAVHYMARILHRFPGTERISTPPAYTHGKRPGDVLQRLQECYRHIETIAKTSGLEVLELKLPKAEMKSIQPSDVYDMASLLVSNLAYFHGQLLGARDPAKAYDPGRKFPSHVYQRAGILLTQLRVLEKHVHDNPNWLKG